MKPRFPKWKPAEHKNSLKDLTSYRYPKTDQTRESFDWPKERFPRFESKSQSKAKKYNKQDKYNTKHKMRYVNNNNNRKDNSKTYGNSGYNKFKFNGNNKKTKKYVYRKCTKNNLNNIDCNGHGYKGNYLKNDRFVNDWRPRNSNINIDNIEHKRGILDRVEKHDDNNDDECIPHFVPYIGSSVNTSKTDNTENYYDDILESSDNTGIDRETVDSSDIVNIKVKEFNKFDVNNIDQYVFNIFDIDINEINGIDIDVDNNESKTIDVNDDKFKELDMNKLALFGGFCPYIPPLPPTNQVSFVSEGVQQMTQMTKVLEAKNDEISMSEAINVYLGFE